jgi:hypothetical protein
MSKGINELRFLAHNITANSFHKCVEHARMSYEMLSSFTLPSCIKVDDVSSRSTYKRDGYVPLRDEHHPREQLN